MAAEQQAGARVNQWTWRCKFEADWHENLSWSSSGFESVFISDALRSSRLNCSAALPRAASALPRFIVAMSLRTAIAWGRPTEHFPSEREAESPGGKRMQ